MISLIDSYRHYCSDRYSKEYGEYVTYKTIDGEITYIKYENDVVCVFHISIIKEKRGKGIWSNYIKVLLSDININQIIIAMMANHTIEYSTGKNHLGKNYWINQGGDCIWYRNKHDNNFTGYEINDKRLNELLGYIKNKNRLTY